MSSYSSDDEDTNLGLFDENFRDSVIDYYGDNRALKGLRNITMTATPIIPLLFENEQVQKNICTRNVYKRQREQPHDRIYADYFAEKAKYPLSYFCRRFRMRRHLFLCILHDIECYDSYFTQRCDAIGRLGLSALLKMTASIKMLTTGCLADNLDEYIQIGESTAIESLHHFCSAVIGLYEQKYMRRPNYTDMVRLLARGEARGFPEAVADKDLWIWHAFFGMSDTHNDINVLDRSNLFDEIINDRTPQCNYMVNGHEYNMGYYLADEIYPKYATIIQSISQPIGPKHCLFAKIQEAIRKYVERDFRVLQARFAIVKGSARLWQQKDLAQVMKTCIILHNMIVNDERDENIDLWQPPPNEASQNVQVEHDETLLVATLIAKLNKVRDTTLHDRLKSDLIEHIWKQYGEGLLM